MWLFVDHLDMLCIVFVYTFSLAVIRMSIKDFAVTLSFALGGVVICGILYINARYVDPALANQDIGAWVDATLLAMAYIVLSGLVVDALRLVARAVWTKKLPFRLKLKKVLRENLA
jgi:hypothetical protein